MSGKLKTAKQERRSTPRVKLSQIVRVRPFDFRLSEDYLRRSTRPRTFQEPGSTLKPHLGITTQA
jgi:hypothetical protein